MLWVQSFFFFFIRMIKPNEIWQRIRIRGLKIEIFWRKIVLVSRLRVRVRVLFVIYSREFDYNRIPFDFWIKKFKLLWQSRFPLTRLNLVFYSNFSPRRTIYKLMSILWASILRSFGFLNLIWIQDSSNLQHKFPRFYKVLIFLNKMSPLLRLNNIYARYDQTLIKKMLGLINCASQQHGIYLKRTKM